MSQSLILPKKRWIFLILLNFLVILGITIFLTFWLKREIAKEQWNNFSAETNAITVALNERLHIYEALLYSGKGLIDSNNETITPLEWHTYTSALQLSKNYPAVATYGYGFLVTQADKAKFIAQQRQEVNKNFTITPPGNRPLYAVGTYLEPPSPVAEGVDSLVDPVRAKSIDEAFNTGNISISGKTTLYIDKVKEPAFVMRLAFYKQKSATGYVTATFHMQNLIQVALQHNFQGVRFAVYDGTDTKNLTTQRLFYNNLPSSWQTSGRFSKTVTIPIFSHGWTMVFTDTSILSLRDRFAPMIILVVGIILAIVSTCLLYFLVIRKRAAEKLAEKMTEELRISEQKYRTIFETLQDVYYETDNNGNITTVSPSIENYTGIPSSEILGKKVTDFYSNPKERDHLLETLQKQGYILDYEIGLKGKKGNLSVSVTSKVLQDKEGNVVGVGGMLRDITRRKHAEEAVTRKNNELEKAHEELEKLIATLKKDKKKLEEAMTKDEFLSMAAHELRTPLGTMRWRMEDMLSDNKIKLSPSTKENIQKIYGNVLRLIHIVNNLLDVSRINQEKVVDNPEGIDVVTLTQNVLETMEDRISEKDLKVSFKSPKVIPMKVDQNLLEEVLANIISNAVKYSKKKGKLDVELSTTKENLNITVSDTGIGIPPKDQKHIFDKFKRGSNVDEEAIEGNGLGLFVVKKYIDHWKGRISIKSVLNKGTKVTIAIPHQDMQKS